MKNPPETDVPTPSRLKVVKEYEGLTIEADATGYSRIMYQGVMLWQCTEDVIQCSNPLPVFNTMVCFFRMAKAMEGGAK